MSMENETPKSEVDASAVRGLKHGDAEAIERLWADYFQRLVALARKHLPKDSRRAADEEDVALSAFQSLCKGAAAGQFPKLDDREDLWRLLVVITLRKARRAMRRSQSQKRGGGRVSGDSAFFPNTNKQAPSNLAEMLGEGPTPAFAAEVAEECERLLAQLGDDQLRSIALLKMEGYTVAEISQKMSCAHRSVERGLQVIRAKWSGSLLHRE
jgi:DNA-directed RNA polymerase specialized sigma24 family protein